MTMMMSNLPTDLVEEILSRVPVTSTRAVRFTCKKLSTLFKDESFTKKHIAQAASAARREWELQSTGNLISLNVSDKLVITRVYHCEGLLLCVTEDYARLVVWNPYTGQTRWICVEPKYPYHRGIWYGHAVGYDKSTHKVLRYLNVPKEIYVHDIYDVNSTSWRVFDVTPDWDVEFDNYGLSLKGNYLLRFGPRLPLPFESYSEDAVTLSSVREEQLAELFQKCDTCEMEIWVTTKIEPNAMSWSKILAVDMEPFTGFRFYSGGNFVIDEEKRAVVVFDEDKYVSETNRNTAYFIGENSYLREVNHFLYLEEFPVESF